MIDVQNTPNLAGVTVSGDYLDFDQLYDAIYDVLPEEGEDVAFDEARMRVLGFCYDLRHAKAGHRELTYVDNGLNPEAMHDLGIVGSQKNLYFSFSTYYPEMLFVMMALTYAIENKTKNELTPTYRSIQMVKFFQAGVIESLRQKLSSQKFLNAIRAINAGARDLSFYMTQFVDVLNLRFLNWDKDEREKNLAIMAKRIVERGKEYRSVEQEIRAVASEHDCHPSQVRLRQDYPEVIDW